LGHRGEGCSREGGQLWGWVILSSCCRVTLSVGFRSFGVEKTWDCRDANWASKYWRDTRGASKDVVDIGWVAVPRNVAGFGEGREGAPFVLGLGHYSCIVGPSRLGGPKSYDALTYRSFMVIDYISIGSDDEGGGILGVSLLVCVDVGL
jgi:hypothetical protein